jgi:hypothetical protein
MLDGYTEGLYSATTNLVQIVRHKSISVVSKEPKKGTKLRRRW